MSMPLKPIRSNSAVSSGRRLRYCRSRLTNGTCLPLGLSNVEFLDQRHDPVLLLAGNELMYGQRQHGFCGFLAYREVAWPVAKISGRGLKMHRYRIMHLGIDAARHQVLLKVVASLATRD